MAFAPSIFCVVDAARAGTVAQRTGPGLAHSGLQGPIQEHVELPWHSPSTLRLRLPPGSSSPAPCKEGAAFYAREG